MKKFWKSSVGGLHSIANLINATERNSKFYSLYLCVFCPPPKSFLLWSLRVVLKNPFLSQDWREPLRLLVFYTLRVHPTGPPTSSPQWVTEENPNINPHASFSSAHAVSASSGCSRPRRNEKKTVSRTKFSRGDESCTGLRVWPGSAWHPLSRPFWIP